MNMISGPDLTVPDVLKPRAGRMLPELHYETINQLAEAGWSRIGLLIPLITRAGKLLVLKHNESDKSDAGMLGPLGETSKAALPVIEQPMETLNRAIREELGVKEPRQLGLQMRADAGWFTHAWPRGVAYPGEYACAICPPVYVPPAAEHALLSRKHGNEEICGLEAMALDEITATPENQLRPGFAEWVDRFDATGFAEWPSGAESRRLDFSTLFATSLVDLDLQMGA